MNSATDPKVSIIIPVYNTGKYLRRCLTSVCLQTLKELEIICVNDGSTDNSLSILREFADRDSRIILLDQENIGVATARNRGLEKASAPYIGFVDSDDFIAPDMYEKMYIAMVMNDVDFVECGAEVFFEHDLVNKDAARHGFSTKNLSGRVSDHNVLNQIGITAFWKILYKREMLTKYRIRFMAGFNSYEDTYFAICYKNFSQSGFYIPENLYMYFYHINSIIGKTLKGEMGEQSLDVLKLIKLYYFFLHEHNFFEKFENFFIGLLTDRVAEFYRWAPPEIIKSSGIKMIKELLEIEDISALVDEKNKLLYGFKILKDEELVDLSFFSAGNGSVSADNGSVTVSLRKRKITLRKMIKYLLPYGLVRFIQTHKKQ